MTATTDATGAPTVTADEVPISLVDGAPRDIGPGGLMSGPFAFGLARFTHDDVTQAQRLVETALDVGMNLVDTADVYGLDADGNGFGAVEDLLGRVLDRSPALRDQVVVATKAGIRPGVPYDSSPSWLRRACEDSLRRLRVERIDLFQIHRPDAFTHPGDVATVLHRLRDEGKVREIGVSNYSVSQHDALARHLEPYEMTIATTQPEFSVEHLGPMRDGTFDRCARDGVTALVWSPLGGGRIATGDGVRPELHATLRRLAEREGVDVVAIALAFVVAHPVRPVAIVGTQNPDRLLVVNDALRVYLDRADCYDIIEAADGRPLP